jgi:hypothetical protein
VYLLAKLTATLKTFFSEALDAAYGDGCEPRCMYDNYANVGYLSPEVPRALWLWFVRPAAMTGDGNFLHPVPLQVAIAQNGAFFCGRRWCLCFGFRACLCALLLPPLCVRKYVPETPWPDTLRPRPLRNQKNRPGH